MMTSEKSSLIALDNYGELHSTRKFSSRATAIVCICAYGIAALLFGNVDKEDRTSVALMRKSKASKNDKSEGSKEYDCESDIMYSKHTVKTAYERPFAALFKDNKGQNKFEASSVTIVGDSAYAICDSSYAIAKFNDALPFSDENKMIGSPERNGDVESGFEAIFHHEGLFYVVRESVLHHHHDDDNMKEEDEDSISADDKHSFHAIIEELELGDDDYTVKAECVCEFEFEGTSKGFEGAVGFPDATGELYILGLCEGNHCSEERKADAGHGRMVLMKKNMITDPDDPEGENCVWKTVRMIRIPKSAEFIDYSAIDITADGRVAITSQESSALWIGSVQGIDNGVINPETFEFVQDSGETYQFPKSNDCHTVYCNIEGIHWMNNQMLMGVSDKMKSKYELSHVCDQEIPLHLYSTCH